jgi:cell division protein FtsQ
MANKKTIVKWAFNILWMGIGAATVVLLVAAIRIKDARPCREIEVSIAAPGENYFVDKKDILAVISSMSGSNPLSRPAGSFKLAQMEAALKRNVWIKEAQLFFDNNEVLHVNITERTPVARVFGTGGLTFYLDSSASKLPLSEKFSARLPVFTGFPSDKVILSAADSALLKDITTLGMAIAKDSFCMAMIEQVDIKPEGNFEMLLKIGNTVVLFGNAADATAKLERMKLFYRKVIPKAGWNYYSSINVQYSNQVVAARRGAADITADSLRTVQLLQALAAEAEQRASDSSQNFIQDSPGNTADSSIIQQSIQRDDAVDAGGAAVDLPGPAVQQPAAGTVNNAVVPAPAVPQPAAAPKPVVPKPVPKPVVNKPAVPKPKPKPKPPAAARPRAVMPPPPKNDY